MLPPERIEKGTQRRGDLQATARWLALSQAAKLSPYVLAQLYRRVGTSQALFSEPDELLRLALDKTSLYNIKLEAEKIVKQLTTFSTQNIYAIPIESLEYPESLLDLRVPPVVIFISGKILKEDSRAVAIVGTRTPSQQGLRTAEKIAGAAASKGFCVVSGLARGIDTAAHRSSLRTDGRTTAVIGNGLLQCYPPENDKLASRISRQGVLLSELWPEAKVSRKALLARDRLQAALSMAVIVVQTHAGCGSLTTARYAVSCNRPLYAINWEEEPFSLGLARLRQIGAKIISADEIDVILESLEGTNPLHQRSVPGIIH